MKIGIILTSGSLPVAVPIVYLPRELSITISIFARLTPQAPDEGRFRWKESGLLCYAENGQPVADIREAENVLSGEIAISPDKKWAAGDGSKEDGVTFIDGTRKTKKVIIPGWGYQLHWLPAAK